jgi:hypothetical protein
MKSIASVVIAASMLVVPLCGFAQQASAPVTRAEVRADLIAVERAGYTPSSGEDVAYPGNIQAAEAKVSAQHTELATSSIGGVTAHAESGHRPARDMDASCVGPVSFCKLYFGS